MLNQLIVIEFAVLLSLAGMKLILIQIFAKGKQTQVLSEKETEMFSLRCVQKYFFKLGVHIIMLTS